MQDNLVGDGPVQPEIVLPEQFFASIGGRVPLKAEYQLAAAVLQEAVECYQKHLLSTDSKGRVLFTDAQAWIDADDWDWPFSFLNICAILRIDPNYLRGGLRAWHQREAVLKPRATLLSMSPTGIRAARPLPGSCTGQLELTPAPLLHCVGAAA